MTFRAERFHWGDDVELDWHPASDKKSLRTKFDPSEPRDEAGKWTDGGGSSGGGGSASDSNNSIASGGGPPVVAFHGTIEKVIESIKKEGLHVKPGSKHFDGDVYSGERGESVFVTTKKEVAIEYAASYAQSESWKDYKAVAPVVFKLEIPQAEWVNFKEDKLQAPERESRYGKAIPPEWIKGVFKVGSGDALEEIKADHVTAYMVIFVGEPKSEEEKAFDEGKHPRVPAGGPGGGEFTSGGSGGEAKPSTEEAPGNFESKVLEKSREVAEQVGYDPKLVVVKSDPTVFELMGKKMKAGASSFISGEKKGLIEVYPEQVRLKGLPGVIAHEVEHQKFQAAMDDVIENKNDKSPLVKALFTVDPDAFSAADGVSPYSRAYWEDWLKDKADLPTTLHETLAEIARIKYETGKFPKHQGGEPSDANVWRTLYKAVDEAYKGLAKK